MIGPGGQGAEGGWGSPQTLRNEAHPWGALLLLRAEDPISGGVREAGLDREAPRGGAPLQVFQSLDFALGPTSRPGARRTLDSELTVEPRRLGPSSLGSCW